MIWPLGTVFADDAGVTVTCAQATMMYGLLMPCKYGSVPGGIMEDSEMVEN